MARHTFGGTANDWVYALYQTGSAHLININARNQDGTRASVTCWDSREGGTQYTDLLLDGDPVTEIPSQEYGQIPAFDGPDGVTEMWAQAGETPHRVRIMPPSLPGPAGPGASDEDVAGYVTTDGTLAGRGRPVRGQLHRPPRRGRGLPREH